jgi:hypothetical protein
MKKLGFLNCGGARAANCVPPTPRRDDRAAPAAHREEAGSPRRFDRAGPLDGLNRRAFKAGLKSWAADYGLPAEQRQQAVGLLLKAADEGAPAVRLPGLGLRRLPAEIGMLTKTKALDAQNNDLKRLPKEIGDMHGLHFLELQDNSLPSLPPELGRLSKLTHLNLDQNLLERLPDEIEGLINLRTLSAKNNLLSQVPVSMKNLPNLRELNLQHNQLWQLPGGWDELFHRLRRLDLSHNKLTELPVTFANPARSIKVNLAHNRDLNALPTKFGGFEYGSAFDNHTLINHARKIEVNTENTGIRRTLVQEGRLKPGRGIDANDRPVRASQRPPAAGEYEPNLGSVYSVDDYVREHGQPGQAIGPEATGRPDIAPRADALGPQPAWTRPADAWLQERAQHYAERFGAPLPTPPAPAPQPAYAANWGAWPHLGLPGVTTPAAAPRQFNFDMPAAVPPNLDVHALANLLIQLSGQPQAVAAAPFAAGLSSLHAAGPSMPSTSHVPQPAMPANFTNLANPAAMSWAQFEQPLPSPPPWAEAVHKPASTGGLVREKAAPPAWAAQKPATEAAPRAAAMPDWIAPKPPAEPAKQPEPDVSPEHNAPGIYGGVDAYPEVRDYGGSYGWPSSPPTEPESAPSGAVDLLERMMSAFKPEY